MSIFCEIYLIEIDGKDTSSPVKINGLVSIHDEPEANATYKSFRFQVVLKILYIISGNIATCFVKNRRLLSKTDKFYVSYIQVTRSGEVRSKVLP